jgi:hypothetical protein
MINFNDGTYFPGDRVTLDLDFAPAAVPEPSTIALAGTGALGLLGYVRRRRKAA